MNEIIKQELREAAVLFVKLTALAALGWYGAYPFEWLGENVWEGFYPLGLVFLLSIVVVMLWLSWGYFTRQGKD